jgi:hypothetical protein
MEIYKFVVPAPHCLSSHTRPPIIVLRLVPRPPEERLALFKGENYLYLLLKRILKAQPLRVGSKTYSKNGEPPLIEDEV